MNICEKINKRGFTIIELIVVIAIIAVLATVVITSVNKYMAKARDSRRIADANSIVKALQIYYADTGSYPFAYDYGENSPADPYCWGGGPDCSYVDQNGNGIYFLDPLVQGKYLPPAVDPINDKYHTYMYWKFSNYQNCVGNWIVVIASGLEIGGGANNDGDCLTTFDGNTKVYKVTLQIP